MTICPGTMRSSRRWSSCYHRTSRTGCNSGGRWRSLAGIGFELRALALQFAVEVAFGLAQLASETLEGVLLIHTGFSLQPGQTQCDSFTGCRRSGGSRGGGFRRRFDEQCDFAADAIARSERTAGFGDRRAQELFVNLGQLA